MQPFNLLKYLVIYVVAVNVSSPPDGFFGVGEKTVFTSRRFLHAYTTPRANACKLQTLRPAKLTARSPLNLDAMLRTIATKVFARAKNSLKKEIVLVVKMHTIIK